MPDRKGNAEQPFSGWYKNYEGKVQWRVILPIELWYGSTEWHPAEQWFVKAYDPQKDAQRDFALGDFLGDKWDAAEQMGFDAPLDEQYKALTAAAANLGYQLCSDEQVDALGASLTVGGGLVVHGSMEALSRVQTYILLGSNHPIEKQDTNRKLVRDLQAAEREVMELRAKVEELTKLMAKEKG